MRITHRYSFTGTNWYDACKNKALITGGVRPGKLFVVLPSHKSLTNAPAGVNFRLDIFMNIAGLTGQHSAVNQVSSATCPIELPLNSS